MKVKNIWKKQIIKMESIIKNQRITEIAGREQECSPPHKAHFVGKSLGYYFPFLLFFLVVYSFILLAFI